MPVTWLPTLAQSAGGRVPSSSDLMLPDNSAGKSAPDESPDDRKPGQRSKYVEALAAVLGQPTSAQLINQSEQRVEPGSRAFGRQQRLEQAGAQITRADQGFKQALRAAREQQTHPEPADAATPTAAKPSTQTTSVATAAANESAMSETSAATRPTTPTATVNTTQTNGAQTPGTATVPTAASTAQSAPSATSTVSASTAPAGNPTTTAKIDPVAPANMTASIAPVASAAPSGAASSTTGTTSSAPSSSAAPISGISSTGAKSGESNTASTAAKEIAQAEPDPDSDRARTIDRIVQLVRSRSLGEKTSATLRLDPPNLGTLKLHMDLDHDQLTLRMEPETITAQELLTKHMDQLRSSLEAGGIQLVQVQIVPPTQPMDGRDAQAFNNTLTHGGRQGGEATSERRSRRSSEAAALDGPGMSAGGPQVFSSAAESRVNLVA